MGYPHFRALTARAVRIRRRRVGAAAPHCGPRSAAQRIGKWVQELQARCQLTRRSTAHVGDKKPSCQKLPTLDGRANSTCLGTVEADHSRTWETDSD